MPLAFTQEDFLVICVFFSDMSARTARVLMLMVIPGHLIFMYTIHYMEAGHTSITFIFSIAYLTAACIQVHTLFIKAIC